MLHGNNCLKEAGPVHLLIKSYIFKYTDFIITSIIKYKHLFSVVHVTWEPMIHYVLTFTIIIRVQFRSNSLFFCHLMMNCSATGTTAKYRLTQFKYLPPTDIQVFTVHNQHLHFMITYLKKNEGLYYIYIAHPYYQAPFLVTKIIFDYIIMTD